MEVCPSFHEETQGRDNGVGKKCVVDAVRGEL
jgi:hypothetical protein